MLRSVCGLPLLLFNIYFGFGVWFFTLHLSPDYISALSGVFNLLVSVSPFSLSLIIRFSSVFFRFHHFQVLFLFLAGFFFLFFLPLLTGGIDLAAVFLVWVV